MNDFFKHFDEFLKLAENAFSYEKIFDLSGITDILKKMYIFPKDLTKEYVDIFYKAIREFIRQPLYKDTSLNDAKDLKFLKTDEQFKSKIQVTISKVKKELDSRTTRVMEELLNYGSNEEISLEEFSKAVKLDRASLLFILDDLKDTGVIYDYNGREITTK